MVAASQTGSYLGSPQAGRGSAWTITWTICGWPAQYSISLTAPSGSSIETQIEPRQRSCQLFLPSSQWFASQWFVAMAFDWESSGVIAIGPSGSRIAMSQPASMITCRNARSGSEPGKFPSSGNESRRIACAR